MKKKKLSDDDMVLNLRHDAIMGECILAIRMQKYLDKISAPKG